MANVYLPYVLDQWFKQEVQPRLIGRAFLIRYADDAVLAFRNESDTRRVMGPGRPAYGAANSGDSILNSASRSSFGRAFRGAEPALAVSPDAFGNARCPPVGRFVELQ